MFAHTRTAALINGQEEYTVVGNQDLTASNAEWETLGDDTADTLLIFTAHPIPAGTLAAAEACLEEDTTPGSEVLTLVILKESTLYFTVQELVPMVVNSSGCEADSAGSSAPPNTCIKRFQLQASINVEQSDTIAFFIPVGSKLVYFPSSTESGHTILYYPLGSQKLTSGQNIHKSNILYATNPPEICWRVFISKFHS